MSWISLVALWLALWAASGGVIAIGHHIWSLQTALVVHFIAALVFAFLAASVHCLLAPGFDGALRATVITGIIVALDASGVAPYFERSYEMFRSALGT
jgi:hypothetical protein